MQETTLKHRADWLIRYQITEFVSAMKEAEYSVEWKQNKRSYLIGIANTLHHIKLITIIQHGHYFTQ